MAKPQRLIALEEHFQMPGGQSPTRTNNKAQDVENLTNFDRRIEVMDRYGIDMQVLSYNGVPWRDEKDPAKSAQIARKVNDYMAEMCVKYPGRFAALASVPVQDPKAAADELERAVNQLGHKGTMVHHMGTGDYLDDDRYSVLWERAEALGVPLYLHPAATEEPHPLSKGYRMMETALWSWTSEMSGHALRMVLGGVFDRYPKAKLILGHMGEALPFLLWRIDSRYQRQVPAVPLKHLPSHYIRENIAITTSGQFNDAPLICSRTEMGIDSILFSVDYPYESDGDAVAWIAKLPLPQEDIEKIAHGNVERLLKL